MGKQIAKKKEEKVIISKPAIKKGGSKVFSFLSEVEPKKEKKTKKPKYKIKKVPLPQEKKGGVGNNLNEKGKKEDISSPFYPQEKKEGNVEKVTLNYEIGLLDKQNCPKCNSSLKRKVSILRDGSGRYALIGLRCKKSRRRLFKMWQKPTCDYWEEIIERID